MSLITCPHCGRANLASRDSCVSCGAEIEKLPEVGSGAIAMAMKGMGNAATAVFGFLDVFFRGRIKELNCPACGERRPMRRFSRAKHSQLAAWFAAFLSVVFFWLGFITWFATWLPSAFFFLLFLYWFTGTENFWRCDECGTLLPRG